MSEILTMSKEGNSEYCCNVVQIGVLKPIEGSDFLSETLINGQSVVVRKDQVKEGELYFYASNECQLNVKFLSVNNLFDIGNYELNSNKEEVEELLSLSNKETDKDKSQEYKEQAKKKVGFFSKTGRVRMIRLRKIPSYGFLFGKEEMEKYCPKVSSINMEDYLNKDFDTVGDEPFVKAYVPYSSIRERKSGQGRNKKAQKKVDRFDKIIPGEFMLHYDTKPLGKNMWMINPSDVVTISVKEHGTSICLGNVKVKMPIKLPLHKWLFNKFVDTTGLLKSHRITDYEIVYDNIYSSRTVIKNQYINKEVNDGYYNTDVWGEYNELLKGKIEEGMTVYGEIVGYLSNSSKMIQKDYDYGCAVGTNKLMPYRITSTTTDGKKYEWNVNEVKEWTKKLIETYPEINERIEVIPILYHGTLQDLYPQLDIRNHWNEEVLEALKSDKEHFGMEELEPICKNKVYREGIVIRIDNDTTAEAFKLKTDSFYFAESKAIDKGQIDIEMMNNYVKTEEING